MSKLPTRFHGMVAADAGGGSSLWSIGSDSCPFACRPPFCVLDFDSSIGADLYDGRHGGCFSSGTDNCLSMVARRAVCQRVGCAYSWEAAGPSAMVCGSCLRVFQSRSTFRHTFCDRCTTHTAHVHPNGMVVCCRAQTTPVEVIMKCLIKGKHFNETSVYI